MLIVLDEPSQDWMEEEEKLSNELIQKILLILGSLVVESALEDDWSYAESPTTEENTNV